MLKEIIYEAIILFGNTTVREVMELARIGNVNIIYENLISMNMKRHAECMEFLFTLNKS